VVVKRTTSNKCVVLLSGGPDSATVGYWAKKKGYDISAMACIYGQIAVKEVESAARIASELGATIKVIDLSSLREIFVGVTSLVDDNVPMTSSFTQPIIVPFRNAIFLSAAVAYSAALDTRRIYCGAQGSDAPYYPDCRKEFYDAFQTAARLGTDREIFVEAPFSQMSKSDVVKLGTELGVPYDLTWSCYFNRAKHCGACESCNNRKKAFKEAGITDPTQYETAK